MGQIQNTKNKKINIKVTRSLFFFFFCRRTFEEPQSLKGIYDGTREVTCKKIIIVLGYKI